MKKRILLVEDEPNLSNSLSLILAEENYEVLALATGRPAIEKFQEYDLLVLDLMLPDIDGVDVVKAIRDKSPQFPIIIISSRSSEDDLVQGLSAGADDYMTKPFSIKELLLRIRRMLVRQKFYLEEDDTKKNSKDWPRISCFQFPSGLRIDFANFRAHTLQGEIALTTQEAYVLHHLVEYENQVVARQDLLAKIWGHNLSVETRTIDNFVVRFRKYFENNTQKPKHFITKRGVGYLFKSKS